MYLKLTNNSFLKKKPNEKMLSSVIKGVRNNIVINESAYEILALCNGDNSVASIKEELNKKYNNADEYVSEFLQKNIEQGIIEKSDVRQKIDIIKGKTQFYYPDILIWEITDKCPLKCRHCYLGDKTFQELSKDEIDEVLNLVKETGITTVQLTGGEIFTHSLLGYIIDRLNEMDITISLSTSGFIQNENVKEILRKLRKTSVVRVSIDGDEEYHNFVRQNNEAYKRCIEFVKYLKSNNIRVQAGTVILHQSEEMIENTIKLAKKLGISSHSFSVVLEEGSALDNLEKSVYSNSELMEKLKEWNKKYSDLNYIIQLPSNNGLKNCGCGYKLIRIKENYDVTPCPMIDYDIGNLKQESFDTIMQRGSRIFEELYSPKHEEKTYCEKCKFKEKCGDCIAMALVQNKNCNEQCFWVQRNYGCLSGLFRR